MKRTYRIGAAVAVACLVGLGLSGSRTAPEARAQKAGAGAGAEPAWEYRVGLFSYNPGDRATDEQRAKAYERALNEQARQGWEAVGSVLSRDTVQTVGGGVTTRETTSFVAYRRPRR